MFSDYACPFFSMRFFFNRQSENESEADEVLSVDFCGLIITRLTRKDFTMKELIEFSNKLSEIVKHQRLYLGDLFLIHHVLEQIPLRYSQRYFPVLHQMAVNPQVRKVHLCVYVLCRRWFDSFRGPFFYYFFFSLFKSSNTFILQS